MYKQTNFLLNSGENARNTTLRTKVKVCLTSKSDVRTGWPRQVPIFQPPRSSSSTVVTTFLWHPLFSYFAPSGRLFCRFSSLLWISNRYFLPTPPLLHLSNPNRSLPVSNNRCYSLFVRNLRHRKLKNSPKKQIEAVIVLIIYDKSHD